MRRRRRRRASSATSAPRPSLREESFESTSGAATRTQETVQSVTNNSSPGGTWRSTSSSTKLQTILALFVPRSSGPSANCTCTPS